MARFPGALGSGTIVAGVAFYDDSGCYEFGTYGVVRRRSSERIHSGTEIEWQNVRYGKVS